MTGGTTTRGPRTDALTDTGSARLDFGRPTLRVRGRRFSVRLDLRTMLVTVALVVAALTAAVVSLGLGDIQVSVPDTVRTLLGDAPSHKAEVVVTQWRLPRIALSLVLGAALGTSGAIFQSLTENPLGSPDVIGFSTGSYTGAVLVMVLLPGSQLTVTGGAILGGAAVAVLVYLLSWRGALTGSAGAQGFRLIIVGIAISAMLASVTTWILLIADLRVVMSAAVWGAGSLNAPPDGALPVAAIGTGIVMIGLLMLLPRARLLESGPDTARALGVRIQPVRLALIAAGVALVGMATAAAGPIAFVALVAPQLSRRLTRAQGLDLAGPAAMGALLLVGSDAIARVAFAPQLLPVGVVTVCLGGGYLVWLLIREARRR